MDVGGSGLARRGVNGAAGAEHGRVLPDFMACGYEQAVKRAKEDIKVMMVVLTCDEHQYDEEFKKWVIPRSLGYHRRLADSPTNT